MGASGTSERSNQSPSERSDRPRDAATLVVVDHSTGEPRVLMGRRRPDQVFLPNKFVFPGGRVDRADRNIRLSSPLRATEEAKLLLAMRGEPTTGRAQALALAAIRETFEETGLMVGVRQDGLTPPTSETWRRFFEFGFAPCLSVLTYFARAITPPGRPRRYDTRFFTVDASAIGHRVEATDGELLSLDWFSLDDARSLDLPGITRVIVEDLADWLSAKTPGSPSAPVPFYFHRRGTFERVLLSADREQPLTDDHFEDPGD